MKRSQPDKLGGTQTSTQRNGYQHANCLRRGFDVRVKGVTGRDARIVHNSQQTGVYPYPLVAGSARPNPRMGAPDPENPLFLGFSVLRGGLRPWSQTMVSEGARPSGRGRSGDCETGDAIVHKRQRNSSHKQLGYQAIPHVFQGFEAQLLRNS